MRTRLFAAALLALSVAWPLAVHAQIEGNLGVYSGSNAEGYLEPLKDALGAGLADGLFTSAAIGASDISINIGVRAMLISWNDEDRTFAAQTESYYPDPTTVDAPTVIGDTDGVSISDPDSGAAFHFPGGLDIDRTGLAVPQLTVGGFSGSEAILRWISVDTGDNEIGDVSLFGIGGRHSLSQYLDHFPVELAGMIMWQTLKLGDDFIEGKAFTIGVQASKRFQILEPYGGLAFDNFSMTVDYEQNDGGGSEPARLEFDSDRTLHLTLGTGVHLGPLKLNGELNVARQSSISFGLGAGI